MKLNHITRCMYIQCVRCWEQEREREKERLVWNQKYGNNQKMLLHPYNNNWVHFQCDHLTTSFFEFIVAVLVYILIKYMPSSDFSLIFYYLYKLITDCYLLVKHGRTFLHSFPYTPTIVLIFSLNYSSSGVVVRPYMVTSWKQPWCSGEWPYSPTFSYSIQECWQDP